MSEKSFTDALDREWHLSFTIGDSIYFRDELGIDIGKLLDDGNGELEKLLRDEWKIFAILGVLLEKQLKARKMLVDSGDGDDSKKMSLEFYNGMTGEVIDSATQAFLYAVSESLPKVKRRAMQALLKKLPATMEAATVAMDLKIGMMDLTKEVTEKIENSKF